ncbi:MAG TPA: hypothetical protein VJ959_12695 [Desulfotignum sp.]|nr:hypothetical protein [Desulfotignum sp.]
MAHEDKGHYADKHPDQKTDPVIAAKLQSVTKENQLSCASAHKAAAELGVAPKEVGIQADLLELRIVKCQLGLFGYEPEQKRIDPEIDVSDDLWATIENQSTDGKISCRESWDIAKDFKISRLHMGSACEKINIRVKPCQLGAF